MIFLITNGEKLTQGQLLLKVRAAALSGADYILLRENHLSDESYLNLARSIQQLLNQTQTELVVCHRPHIAKKIGSLLHSKYDEQSLESFSVSTHSKEEMVLVARDKYCFYSHVFETKCKEGLEPRSLKHLDKHPLTVALGGINKKTVVLLDNRVKHIALMSSWQETEDIKDFVDYFKKSGY